MSRLARAASAGRDDVDEEREENRERQQEGEEEDGVEGEAAPIEVRFAEPAPLDGRR
jgi:2-methylaconitate cis-trans-isomerase PrpF